ncbi:MAG: hypothetical protein CSA50_04540 [Gammaproteobacteria bacterium]|nr:MAG: hypothetical protein CSA50_04540 [Gammaproteobacteria bacterium]
MRCRVLSDPNADIWIYTKAASPLPKAEGYVDPDGYFEYLHTIRQSGVHGEAFGYRTVNSDSLGWIVSRLTGKDLVHLLSERIWSRVGAERDGGKISGQRLFPEQVVNNIQASGDKKAPVKPRLYENGQDWCRSSRLFSSGKTNSSQAQAQQRE